MWARATGVKVSSSRITIEYSRAWNPRKARIEYKARGLPASGAHGARGATTSVASMVTTAGHVSAADSRAHDHDEQHAGSGGRRYGRLLRTGEPITLTSGLIRQAKYTRRCVHQK
ncbi:hypothetical protein MTO96_047014 [Rhipicephalus appendiculatus]